MGNCFCSPEQHLAPSVHGRLIVDDTTETTSEGLRIQLSAAAWAAHHPCEDAYCIQVQNRSIFVAMFDGIGGPEAAQVCKANAWPVFQACMQASNGDVQKALTMSFRQLEAQFFEISRTLQVKAYTGATATIAFLDLKSRVCTVATHGPCLCVQGVSHGTFKMQTVVANVLEKNEIDREASEVQRLRDAFPGATSMFESVAGKSLLMGLSPVTRAIGLGVLKHVELADWHNRNAGGRHQIFPLPTATAQYIAWEPFVETTELSLDGHPITLGSSGFWNLISPTAAATWCHAWWSTSVRHALSSGHQGEPHPDLPGVLLPLKSPSLAAGLVIQAVAGASTSLPPKLRKHKMLATVDDLERIPCANLADTLGQMSRRGGIDSNLPKASRLKHGDVARSDFHDDLTCVTISWEKMVGAPSFDDMPVGVPVLQSAFKKTALERAGGLWDLVRSYYKFSISHRRTILAAWMTVIDKAFQNHKRAQYEQARQQEINAWRTEGRAIKVSNSGGVSAVEVVV